MINVTSTNTITTGSPIFDQIIGAIVVIILVSAVVYFYKHRNKLTRKNKDFSNNTITKKSQAPITSLIRFLSLFHSPSVIYNKTLTCGCLAKDTLIVKLCSIDKQRYMSFGYQPPEGYYISDDSILDY